MREIGDSSDEPRTLCSPNLKTEMAAPHGAAISAIYSIIFCDPIRAFVEMGGIEPPSITEQLRLLRVQSAERVTRSRSLGQTP